MDVEESLDQNPRDACIAEDTASIDLVWFENHEVESCEKRHSMSVSGWRFILQKDKEWRNEFQHVSRLRSSPTIVILT